MNCPSCGHHHASLIEVSWTPTRATRSERSICIMCGCPLDATVDVFDMNFLSATEVIATWSWMGRGRIGPPIATLVTLSWQKAEPDVGFMHAGYVADGDAPDAVLMFVADAATSRSQDPDYDDEPEEYEIDYGDD